MRRIASILRVLKNFLMGRKDIVTVDLYMKSGNVVSVDVLKMNWKTRGGQIDKLTWETPPFNDHSLSMINPDQIEAIVVHD